MTIHGPQNCPDGARPNSEILNARNKIALMARVQSYAENRQGGGTRGKSGRTYDVPLRARKIPSRIRRCRVLSHAAPPASFAQRRSCGERLIHIEHRCHQSPGEQPRKLSTALVCSMCWIGLASQDSAEPWNAGDGSRPPSRCPRQDRLRMLSARPSRSPADDASWMARSNHP